MSSPFKAKQKLSPEAKKAKHSRDVAAAKTPLRKKRKRENQALDRAEGTVGDGLDRHHTKSGAIKKVSPKSNRDVWKRGERT
tara:strand:- start:276 stop:521 length:246 start_codon:yes stop_codon:yes gene_type:complete